ncbi:MAG: septal ring lytic transglycosylase RlpA family protein [Coriobacteriales bacterium]|nr:septal ring lytic transglycosylase RlpA family protein [Coriobacteriales bacterium]
MGKDKRRASRLLKKSTTVLMATVFLLVGATAFGDFSTSGSRVLGVGRIQSESTTIPIDVSQKLTSTVDTSGSTVSTTNLTVPIDRDLTAEKSPIPPAPVVNRYSDGEEEYRVSEWNSGLASAYGDGFINKWTAIGHEVTEDSMGVAVPVSWAYLLGRTVEIEYGGTVVTAIINDTGPFAQWGRVLDLQPGVWKAFGFEDEYEWGVRTVRYRIVG